MILIIGGTSDSRVIAGELKKKGARVLVSAATGYGADLAAEDEVEVLQGRLDSEQIKAIVESRGVKVLVDASHPYAEMVSKNAAEACSKAGINYIRFARPAMDVLPGRLVEVVDDYAGAAVRACAAGKIILVATGGKTALIFAKEAIQKGKRAVFRVLPDPAKIQELIDSGISPGDIVAMQGPFSEELNVAMIRHFRADVMVTKESGSAGGFMEKVRAAERTGTLLIVVRRPLEQAEAIGTVEETVKRALAYAND